MTHILPADKLDAILADLRTYDIDRLEAIRRIDELVTGALVAELENMRSFIATLRRVRVNQGQIRYVERLAIYDFIDAHLAQLTTVPDLPSEQETLREQGQITQPNIFPKGGLVDSITKIDGFDRPSPEQRSEAAPEGGKDA